MKTISVPTSLSSRIRSHKGFALVITLSLMVLLTLLAVGLLTLSAVTLRASGQGNAMAQARSNARLAMMLALGELQKTTGSDRAITAPASLREKTVPSGLTGAWEAWDKDTTATTNDAADAKFIRWLVSSPDPESVIDPNRPVMANPDTPGVAMMLGNGSLGKRANRLQDDQRIALETTALNANRQSGRLAWLVLDESVKSRVDLYHDAKVKTPLANISRAGAPPTDGAATLNGWSSFTVRDEDQGKLATVDTLPLTTLITADDAMIYDPDITVYSNSLMTDPVNGGFKKDLSLLSSNSLSSELAKARLYNYTGVIKDSQPSDPYLSLLTNYHQLYELLGKREGSVRPGSQQVAAQLPRAHRPYRGNPATDKTLGINQEAPTEPLLVPSVLRVDMIFSMIARNAHGGWKSRFGPSRPYLLHMQYLPVVTLHNPYSVPIVFEGMRVTFKNLPVGFNFLIDGQPLSTSLVALNQMYVYREGNDQANKEFGITLRSSLTSSISMTLEPGQTKLFGTPRVSPSYTWAADRNGDGAEIFDWRSDKTADFALAPTMVTSATSAIGFDIDWINPAPKHTSKGTEVGDSTGMVSLKGSEKVGVQFGPYAPPAGGGAFTMAIDLLTNIRSSNPTVVKAGGFEVKYGNAARLKEIFESGQSVRFNESRRFPETYPKPRVDPDIRVTDIYEQDATPLRAYIKPKPFMIFSLSAKTTKESFLPSKTLLAGNPTTNLGIVDLTKGKDPLGGVPLELVMMPIRKGNAAIDEIRGKQEGFFFSGNSSLNGTPRATFYEFPMMPLQSLAQFRHANLANSGYMPFTTYTVGESYAHPQIGTDVTRNNWTDRTIMLDHTYLANKALWDQYFLSTIADQTGPLFTTSSKSYTEVMEDFFSNKSKLLNARFSPYNRVSQSTPADLNDKTAYENVAAYMLLAGGFNINSTSVDAWRNVLASLDQADIETYLGTDTGGTDRYPVLRVRRPSEKAIDANLLPNRQNNWQGYKRLTRDQIDALAEKIVAEVRSRGPFLSMADFVNRGVGAESDETKSGAIQTAIDAVKTINVDTEVDGKWLEAADVSLNGYNSVGAGIGNTAVFAPGMVSQGDILSVIGSRITVRGDTFRIRGYGEARDTTGREVLATAWCEAVVQRVPDYVDSTVKSTVKFDELKGMNLRFGRRYEIVAFRWLNPSEV